MRGKKKPMEPLYVELGKRVKFVREQRGLTQGRLADRAGVCNAIVSNIETARSRCSLHTFLLVAEALETSPKYLLKEAWK